MCNEMRATRMECLFGCEIHQKFSSFVNMCTNKLQHNGSLAAASDYLIRKYMARKTNTTNPAR